MNAAQIVDTLLEAVVFDQYLYAALYGRLTGILKRISHDFLRRATLKQELLKQELLRQQAQGIYFGRQAASEQVDRQLDQKTTFKDFVNTVAKDEVLAPYIRIFDGIGGYYSLKDRVIYIGIEEGTFDSIGLQSVLKHLCNALSVTLQHELVHFSQHQRAGFTTHKTSPKYYAALKELYKSGRNARAKLAKDYFEDPLELMAKAKGNENFDDYALSPKARKRFNKYRYQYGNVYK